MPYEHSTTHACSCCENGTILGREIIMSIYSQKYKTIKLGKNHP